MADAADLADSQYDLVWKNKPLGFSIVMDTTGRNAYVSSIQKKGNVDQGLKLAAQIVKINGVNQKGRQHKDILNSIKSADLPITLTFQPRTFANEKDAEKKEKNPCPEFIKIETADPKAAIHRINGVFGQCKGEVINGMNCWSDETRRKSGDPEVVVWFYPEKVNKFPDAAGDLWMITRRDHINIEKPVAYAVVQSSEQYPTNIAKNWNAWSTDAGKFIEAKIKIAQEKV
jgi:hypothetical protein